MSTMLMAVLLLSGLAIGFSSYQDDQDEEETNANGDGDTSGSDGGDTGGLVIDDPTTDAFIEFPQLSATPLDPNTFANPNGVVQVGTPGFDQIAGSGDVDALAGGAGDDVLDGFGGSDGLLGEEGDDTLRGGAGSDALYGGSGVDEMSGGDGDDVLFGEAGNDTLEGDDGDDWLSGDGGNDSMVGGAGNDILVGVEDFLSENYDFSAAQQAGDTIVGGDGNDIVVVGEGDVASLGSGIDAVATGDWVENDVPVVTDFDVFEDVIEVNYRSGSAPSITWTEQDGNTTVLMNSKPVLILENTVGLTEFNVYSILLA